MANQIVVSAGAKVRNLDGVLTGTSGVVNSLPINASNGIPQLDVNGKILVSQLPNSVMEYQGVWNANTNTPTLTNGGAFNQGDVYLCNVAGTTNFGAGPISFIVGDQAIYSGTIWQKAGGATGTVTSVSITESGDSLNITGSPITTSGTINIGFNGTNLQYVNGAGNLTTFPTLITSIGLSMPSAFSVSNSPLTANGTIAVTGAGTTAQYIRGDGSLATFPTIATEAQRLITEVYNETGATLTKGTVVYINGGHGNLPTITKAIATGDATSAQTYGIVQTDITNMNNGYVVVIGSLGDLDTQAYANGTQLYLSSTTAGAWTSVKQYAPAHLVYVGIVTRSHPTQGVVEVRIQNGFEMDELHNVSAQSPLNNQGLFYNTSTSLWENKSIATALGYTPANDALVVHNTGNETIGGTKTFSDATKNNGGIFLQNASSSSLAGYMNLGGLTNGVKFTSGGGISNTFTLPSATGYTFTFPNATGTIALTSDLAAYVPITRTLTGLGSISVSGSGDLSANRTISIAQSSVSSDGYLSATNFNTFNNKQNALTLTTTGTSGAATLVGATLNIPQYTDAYTGTVTSVAALTLGTSGTDLSSSVANSTTTPVITLNVPTASATNRGVLASADWTTFNSKQGTITLTTTGTSGAATFSANTLNIPNYAPDLSGYVTLATTQTITGAKQFNAITTFGSTGGSGLRVYGGSGTNQWDVYLNSTNLRFSDNTGTGSIVFDRPLSGTSATFSSSVTAGTRIIVSGSMILGEIISSYSTIETTTGNGIWLRPAGGSDPIGLKIATTGAASFSSSITAGVLSRIGDVYIGGRSGTYATYTDGVFGDNLHLGATATGGAVYINTALSKNLIINPVGGNVLIGTTTDYTSKLVIIPSSNPTSSTGANNQISIGETSNNTGYCLKVGYINTGGGYQGSIQSIAGGSGSTLLLNANGGNVLIGTTDDGGRLVSYSTNAAQQFKAAGTAPAITFSNTVLSPTIGGVLGVCTAANQFFTGTASSDMVLANQFTAGALIFGTSNVERMRIIAGGSLLVGTTSSTGLTTGSSVNVGISLGGGVISSQVNNNSNQYWSKATGYTSGDYTAHFVNGTYVGGISTNGSTTTYAVASDYRLKEDFKDYNGLDLVSKIKTYDYKYKSDKSRSYGVIAHELQSIISYAVTGVKDGKKMQGVDYSKIVPVLIKAIQELKLEIETLKNK